VLTFNKGLKQTKTAHVSVCFYKRYITRLVLKKVLPVICTHCFEAGYITNCVTYVRVYTLPRCYV